MSSAVAVVRLSGRMCWKESLSGIGEAVLGEQVGRGLLHTKASTVALFVLPKIGFYEDFRYLRQNLFDVTQHMVMSLPENLRHLQAGDGGDREAPAKKAPCGWLGHTHRAEDETEERKLAISGLGAAKAAWPQGGPHDEAVHVGFGDDGEATGAGSQTRRIGWFQYFRIVTVISHSLVQVRIPQSQRHVPRHEPQLALGISRTRRLTPGRVWCRQYRPLAAFWQQNQSGSGYCAALWRSARQEAAGGKRR